MITFNFQKKYVAFLDVLGFKEIIFSDEKEKLKIYFETVTEAIKVVQKDKKELNVFLISDSIIIIADDNVTQFKLLLKAIQTIQIRLIIKNIWLRGAVSYGEVDFDTTTNIIAGKALTNAFLLEKEARLPLVLLDPKIIKHLENTKDNFISAMNDMSFFPQQHYNKLIHDTYIDIQEESIFVSFGNRILHEHFFNSTNSLGKIYTDLINNLYSEHKHYAKYFWLKKYFLNCLKEFRETVQEPNMEEELKLNTIESWIDLFKSA